MGIREGFWGPGEVTLLTGWALSFFLKKLKIINKKFETMA